jgi:predicted Fe-Mo cluster-binding NifX family protein
MTRIAIPIFQNRVSPVLDTCQHLLLLDVNQGKEVSRQTVFLGEMPLAERFDIITNLGVVTVICGGVSETFANMLTGSNVLLRNGVAGEVDDVIAAFLEDRINMPRFYMPGFKPEITTKSDLDRK